MLQVLCGPCINSNHLRGVGFRNNDVSLCLPHPFFPTLTSPLSSQTELTQGLLLPFAQSLSTSGCAWVDLTGDKYALQRHLKEHPENMGLPFMSSGRKNDALSSPKMSTSSFPEPGNIATLHGKRGIVYIVH